MKTSFFLFGRMQKLGGGLSSLFQFGCFPSSESAEKEAQRLQLQDFYWLETVAVGPKKG